MQKEGGRSASSRSVRQLARHPVYQMASRATLSNLSARGWAVGPIACQRFHGTGRVSGSPASSIREVRRANNHRAGRVCQHDRGRDPTFSERLSSGANSRFGREGGRGAFEGWRDPTRTRTWRFRGFAGGYGTVGFTGDGPTLENLTPRIRELGEEREPPSVEIRECTSVGIRVESRAM